MAAVIPFLLKKGVWKLYSDSEGARRMNELNRTDTSQFGPSTYIRFSNYE